MQTVKWLNSSIWLIDGTLKCTNFIGQSGPRSNCNDGVLHIPQKCGTVFSPSDGLVSYAGHSLCEGGLTRLQICSRRILRADRFLEFIIWYCSRFNSTNVSEESDLIAFYNELSSLVRSIPKHNVLVIGGDRNAQICKKGNHKFSLHNSSNRNGQHLTDFTIENRLTCLNTILKREGKLWPFTYANNTKA